MNTIVQAYEDRAERGALPASLVSGAGRLPRSEGAARAWLDRLLQACFQTLSQAMRGAAQFCGIAHQGVWARSVVGLLGAESLGAPDFPALLCSDLPLCEIAAVQREQLSRLAALEDTAGSELAPQEPRRILH